MINNMEEVKRHGLTVHGMMVFIKKGKSMVKVFISGRINQNTVVIGRMIK